jgi:hypothetical protein
MPTCSSLSVNLRRALKRPEFKDAAADRLTSASGLPSRQEFESIMSPDQGGAQVNVIALLSGRRFK